MNRRKRIAIVGAGHNALVCACYLAKAGHNVTVFERRPRVGGAVNTEEMWGGYQVDTCSVMHILIHKTPIIEELQLHRFGLEYMQMDPWGFAPFPDGSHIVFYRDLDHTCQSIAAISGRDAEAYRDFVLKWHEFNRPIFEMFAQAPSPGAAIAKIASRTAFAQMRNVWTDEGRRTKDERRRTKDERRRIAHSDMGGLEVLRKVLGNYGKMLDETFISPQLKATIAWMAAQSGPPPSELGSGALAGAHSLYHDVGATHPRGGSGMLAQALARCLEHHGGTVRCDATVKRIVLADGKVRGIELQDGERIAAGIVVSGAHIQTTLLDLVGRERLPGDLRPKVESLRIGNGIGMTVRCAMDELPDYLAWRTKDEGRKTTTDDRRRTTDEGRKTTKDDRRRTTDEGRPTTDDDRRRTTIQSAIRTTGADLPEAHSSVRGRQEPTGRPQAYPQSAIHSAMQLICPSVEYLQRAHEDAQRGLPAQRPALVAMTPSSVDLTIAPPGKHLLYIWAQYHPYELANGKSWDDIREREADRLIETLAEYAPNVASVITHRYIQTPLDLERNLGLLRGNIMHIDMSLDQMFMFRPLPELSAYRTPVSGLYLTGASTHPGGGVSGASGRNTATTVLDDLQRPHINWPGLGLRRRKTKDKGRR